MKSSISIQSLVFYILFLLNIANVNALGITKRGGVSTAQILDMKGATLAINGNQTSCEVALIGANAGFVSANCFNQSDNSAVYSVLVFKSVKDLTPISYTLERSDIHVHPGYNSTTFEYNIAVIEFNKNSTEVYDTYIAEFPFYIAYSSYILRTIDPKTNLWNVPNVVEMPNEDSDCPKWSGLYATNDFVELCTSSVVSPNANSGSCTNPYSALYTSSNNRVGTLALYSHSVIFGNNTCAESARFLNYYTYLFNYEEFAVSVLDRPIYNFNSSGSSYTNTSDISMFIQKTPANVDMTGTTQIGGNVFTRKAPVTSVQSTASHSGLSKGAKIAIGVSIPCGLIILIVVTVLVWRYLKRYHQEKNWNPHAENQNIFDSANQMTIETDIAEPPPYFRVPRDLQPATEQQQQQQQQIHEEQQEHARSEPEKTDIKE